MNRYLALGLVACITARITAFAEVNNEILSEQMTGHDFREVGGVTAQGPQESADNDSGTPGYFFFTHGTQPTLNLASDSAGLLAYASPEYVVRVSELPGTDGTVKSELSFYDARDCRLLANLSIPNRVITVGALGRKEQAQFYIGTRTFAKYRYHDYPLALVLVDLGNLSVERLPLVPDRSEYGAAYRYGIGVVPSGNNLVIKIPHGLRGEYSQPKPAKAEFKNTRVSFSEQSSVAEFPDYQEMAEMKHAELIRDSDAGLGYLGPSVLRATDAARIRRQYAVGGGSAHKSGTLAMVSTDGRLSVLSLAALSVRSFDIARTGSFAPYVFPDGNALCFGEGSFHIYQADQKIGEISVPREDLPAIAAAVRNQALNSRENSIQVTFANSGIGYARNIYYMAKGAPLLRIMDRTGGHVERLDLAPPLKSELERGNVLLDWDLATDNVVMHLNHLGYDVPRYQRFCRSTGRAVGEPWTGGGQEVYIGSSYSNSSEGWRAWSYLNEAHTGGTASCVVLESLSGNRPPIVVAHSLPTNADPLSLRVEGGIARVLYGSSGRVCLQEVELGSGETRLVQAWTFGSQFGIASADADSGQLFIPGASGFDVWSVWREQAPSKSFEVILGELDEYAILLPNGMYAGSPGCENLLRLKAGDGSVDGSSIAPWRNRPAEVLRALGGDPEQIEVLTKVTERWQRRLGFDQSKPEPNASDLPKVSVPERPPLWAKGEEAAFIVEWQKGASPLRNVIVRVNGVESARLEDDALSSATEDKGSVDATVKLAEGQNWIEVTAEDVDGRRSDLQRFRTILKDSPTGTKRYIVALGVSDYAKPELNLQFAAKDAKDLLEALGGEDLAHTLLLANDQVNQSTVEKIREFVGNSTESDEVILFCAGHGVLDDKFDYYFAGHDFDPDRPAETGIKLDDLVGAVSSAKALKRLVLLDTCHAGVVGEKDEMLLAQMDTKLPSGVRAVAQRGMKVQQAADFSASDKQRFIEEMFSLPGTIRGVNIIGASAGAQFALESDKWNNGVFTASVIEGLRDKKADWNQDGRITVSELKNYLGQRVSELTAGAQKPSVVAFEQDQDFDLLN